MGILVSVLTLGLLSCSLLYQIKAADEGIDKALSDMKKADQTLEKAEDFDSEIDSLKPTEENSSTIISKAAALKENVKTSQEDIKSAKEKLSDAQKLRLPAWYKNKYIEKLEDCANEREKGLKEMQKMLAKADNYGKSIQNWYKGNDNINEAARNLGTFTEAIQNEQYASAADEAEKARAAIKNGQTEFNNAASYVNIKIYSDARDAAGIYAEVIDPLQQMVSLTNDMANTPQEAITVDMVNNYIGQIGSLYDQVEQIIAKGDAVAPSDVPEDGSIPQSGQDQLSEWRKENTKTFVSNIKDYLKKADELQDEANSIRAKEQ
jgi:hypothetical protein